MENESRTSRLVFGALLAGNATLLAGCSSAGPASPELAPIQSQAVERASAMDVTVDTQTYGPVKLFPSKMVMEVGTRQSTLVVQQHDGHPYYGTFVVNVNTCEGLASSAAHFRGQFLTVHAGETPHWCEMIVTGGGGKTADLHVDIQAPSSNS